MQRQLFKLLFLLLQSASTHPLYVVSILINVVSFVINVCSVHHLGTSLPQIFHVSTLKGVGNALLDVRFPCRHVEGQDAEQNYIVGLVYPHGTDKIV